MEGTSKGRWEGLVSKEGTARKKRMESSGNEGRREENSGEKGGQRGGECMK